MPFQIVRNDITNMKVDAIVNTANPNIKIGSGLDYAIYQKAGWEELLEERKKIGVIAKGEVAVTKAYQLSAKYLIHAVGTKWKDGDHGECEIVASCYRNALKEAKKRKCESIAMPLISAGNYGFPKQTALEIATREIRAFLQENEMTIYLVVFEETEFELSKKLQREIQSYIDHHYVENAIRQEYFERNEERFSAIKQEEMFARRLKSSEKKSSKKKSILYEKRSEIDLYEERENFAIEEAQADCQKEEKEECHVVEETKVKESKRSEETEETGEISDDASTKRWLRAWEKITDSVSFESEQEFPQKARKELSSSFSGVFKRRSLSDLMKQQNETFQQHLFRLIDERDWKDSDVYKKANVDRKLFSKIRKDVHYQPKKKTALAFAIALELNLDETKDLLQRAGFALSPCSKFDIILEYFIENKIYDIFTINEALFEYEQELLG